MDQDDKPEDGRLPVLTEKIIYNTFLLRNLERMRNSQRDLKVKQTLSTQIRTMRDNVDILLKEYANLRMERSAEMLVNSCRDHGPDDLVAELHAFAETFLDRAGDHPIISVAGEHNK